MRMTVGDLMCETPVTIGPDCSTDEALELFFEYETPELYVVDKSGRLLGLLPDYVLLKTHLSGEAKGATVEQFISRAVTTFSIDSDAAEVARMFRDNQCSRLPVLKSGKLVGIVTRTDVLRLMAILRRIDGGATKTTSGPARPKMLSSSKSAMTRTSRAKSTPTKSKSTGNRSKSTGRRVRTATIH